MCRTIKEHMAPSGSYIRRGIFVLLIAFLVTVPCVTFAADFFGPIVPAICHCDNQTVQGATSGVTTVTSAPDYGCVLQVIENLIKFAVTFGVILCIIWIAYAGFSLMVSGGSPEARSQGKTRLVNALVGIIVLLSAWLIVNFVMGILYNGSFGDWNGILAGSGSDTCIQAHTPVAITAGSVASNITAVAPGTATPPENGQLGVTHGLCADTNTACSVSVLAAEGLNQAQAEAMSCIAVTESSGGANEGNSGTGAQGLFQITATNWNISAYHTGACSSATSRLNNTCNRQTAVLMFQRQGYQPWTGICNNVNGCGYVSYGQAWNPNARACVQKYDPSGLH